MTDVVLKFDYIDDEIRWPKAEGDWLAEGYVKAVANKEGFMETWLNVRRIKKIYALCGRLYVLYDAEDVRWYEPFLAQLPPVAAELDYKIYYEFVDKCDCNCKIWRFSLWTLNEEETFLRKLLGTEVEFAYAASEDASPTNFSITPIDVVLYERRIVGIAIVENPQFKKDDTCDDEEACYRGRYVVLRDNYGYKLFRIYDAPPLEKLLEQLTSPCGTA